MKRSTTPPAPRGNWLVRMECRVLRDVYVEDCTEAEARENPFDHVGWERDGDTIDWTILSVEENQ